MKLNKNETAVEAIGAPWARLAKTLRSARDTHIKLLETKDVKGPIRRSWKRSIKRTYKANLALILKLARRNAKKA